MRWVEVRGNQGPLETSEHRVGDSMEGWQTRQLCLYLILDCTF